VDFEVVFGGGFGPNPFSSWLNQIWIFWRKHNF